MKIQRTKFFASWVQLRRLLMLSILLALTIPATQLRAQFRNVFGNSADNSFNRIIPDGTSFYAFGLEDDKAVVARINANGQLLWTAKLLYSSVFTDGVVEASSGDLLLTGFSTANLASNSSLFVRVTSSGVISNVCTYDTPGFEGFLHIVPTSSTTYSVLGVQTVSGDQDVFLIELSNTGTVLQKQLYQLPGNDQFYYDYEPLLPNQVLFAGLSAGNKGVIYQMDAAGNFVGALQDPSTYTFRDVEALPAPFTPGDFVAGATPNGTGQTPRLIHFDNNLLPIWDVSLIGLNTLEQVAVSPAAEIYVLGKGLVNGVNRAILLKIVEVNNAPVLVWAKHLETGAISHTDGCFALGPTGKIAFSDIREHPGALSLGQDDAFFAVTGPDFISYCTKKDSIRLVPYTNFFDSPNAINPSNYDPPPKFSGLDWQGSSWQTKYPCPDPTPVISCSKLRVLVEPDQTERVVWYDENVQADEEAILFCNPPSGSAFPVGNTTVHCTATNAGGDTASCAFVLSVERMPFDSLQPPAPMSPEGVFDRVRDRFGNPYRLADLQIPETMSGSLLCVNSGYFNLYFEQGCGMDGNSLVEIQRRDVLCQLFSDLSQFIARPANATDKVNIWVRNINNIPGFSPNIAGAATSFYVLPNTIANGPFSGGITDGEIWKTINSGVDSYTGVTSPLVVAGGGSLGFYHGFVTFNFANTFQWHTDLQTPTAFNSLDLYTVALHEAVHALGFASLIRPGGVSVMTQITSGGSSPFAHYFSRYDDFLWTNPTLPGFPNKKLIVNQGPCVLYNYQFNPQVSPNVLQPTLIGAGACTPDKTLCPYAIHFKSTSVTQPVYTPNCWESGSSLSHFEDECHISNPYGNNLYYVMSNATAFGPAYQKRSLKPEERQVLCEIGYQTANSYGNAAQMTYAAYPNSNCPGVGVAGVNDGISPNGTFTYMLGINSSISGINILGNDVAAGFECLEVVYGGGTVSPSSGTAGTNITYNSFGTAGIKLLRYIPVSSAGKKGNITYVFIQVKRLGCTTSSPCQMISNGGFESSANCCMLFPVGNATIDCWEPYFASPDLFSRTCPIGSSGCQLNVSTFNATPPTDSHNGSPNDHIMGLYAVNTGNPPFNYSEAIQTQLFSPMVLGPTYQISFWGKVNNNINGASSNVPAPIQISGATSYPLVYFPFGNNYPGPGLTTLLNITVPNTPGPNGNGWHYLTATFTVPSSVNLPLTNLIVAYPGNGIPQTANGAYVFLDEFSLVPVGNAVTFSPPTPICITTSPIDLSTNANINIPGGTFSGPGMSGSIFNPGVAGIGSHVITYTVTDANGCVHSATATIQVLNGPNVLFANPMPQCLSWSPLNLTQFVSPAGGVFSGPGISGNFFNPVAAGLGTHLITYTYAGGACPVSVTSLINVIQCLDTCEITNICLDFDGLNDFVDVPNPLNNNTLQNNFTVACWFRDDISPNVPPNNILHRLFGFAWNGPRFELGEQDKFLTFFGGTLIQSTVNIRDGQWHHVAAVKFGNFVTIYLDGKAVNGLTSLNVGTFSGAPQNFHIGDWAGVAANAKWQGRIDEFKVWGSVMVQSQIQDEMFCSLDPKNTLLLVHMPFDQFVPAGNNLGNVLADNVVAGGLDGALVNFGLTPGNLSNWVARGRDRLPYCNPDHFAWIEGNNGNNYSGRSKVFDTFIFSAELEERLSPTGQRYNSPVFTKRRVDGSEVFRTLLNFEGVINDFTRTDEGCYLLVGHNSRYLLNTDNRSFVARVQPNGVLDWVQYYDFGKRETLTRIIRSDNPSPAAFPYIICGGERPLPPTLGLNSYDDVILMSIDNQGSIGWVRKHGDIGALVTDDDYIFDLINFQGGYALAGTYRNTAFSQGVIFQCDNTGVQLPNSSQYQLGIIFYDIEPSASGNELIAAGQDASGNALLAKLSPSGTQIWAQSFPSLQLFRRIVVRPNGDIYAVGQRKPTAPYRNVVVKAIDYGTSVGILWQKHAEQSGEINWSPADLAWYSGKKFFYTDTRYGNPNGWQNADIGTALYELDQIPDICPFTKDPLPVAQNYTLAYAQMSPLAGILLTPPTPLVNAPGTPFTLPQDSLCQYSCDCEYTNLSFSRRNPLPGWQVNVAGCGLAPVNLPGCPSQTGVIRFSGRLKCKGGCSFNGLTWKITDPNTTMYTGSSSTATFNINMTLAMLQVPGTYTLELTGHCGSKTCICIIQFVVPVCPAPCTCAQPAFNNAVFDGFNWVQMPNCKFQFKPKSLTTCDAVKWLVAPSGSSNFVNFANTVGNNATSYTFPATGQYVICYTVTRSVPNGGGTCTASRCWTLDVDCSLLANGHDPAGHLMENDFCAGSVVQNDGFTLGAAAGGLADDGTAWNWDYATGNPEIVLEAGKNDPNFVRMRGNSGFADLLYQDSLPIGASDGIKLSFAFRPIPGLVLPGTELVARLSTHKLDSLLCGDGELCQEIMRLDLSELDMNYEWFIANTYDSMLVQGRYLSMHVENPFYESDASLQSVVDIDNVCLRKSDPAVSTDEAGNRATQIQLFPNPTTGKLTIVWTGIDLKNPRVEILGALGQTLRSQQVDTETNRLEINVADLPPGLYLVKIWSGKQALKALKFVKQSSE